MTDIIKLAIRILSDFWLPKNKIIYCFAHNDLNIRTMAMAINKNCQDYSSIYILKNNKSMSGVSNYQDVNNIYSKFDIKANFINYEHSFINTRIESEEIIKWAQKNNITELIICAPPFHILRAFMTLISASIDLNYYIKIYCLTGIVDNWRENTISHQGNSNMSFNDFIESELKRIETYTKKGDIKETNKIWEYLKKI